MHRIFLQPIYSHHSLRDCFSQGFQPQVSNVLTPSKIARARISHHQDYRPSGIFQHLTEGVWERRPLQHRMLITQIKCGLKLLTTTVQHIAPSATIHEPQDFWHFWNTDLWMIINLHTHGRKFTQGACYIVSKFEDSNKLWHKTTPAHREPVLWDALEKLIAPLCRLHNRFC